VKEYARISVKEFTIEYGEWKLGKAGSYLIQATDENINALLGPHTRGLPR